jgi:hypothetical protein
VIIPGAGQVYNGRILAGILWLIVTPGLWIGTGGLLGWASSLASASPAKTRWAVGREDKATRAQMNADAALAR